MRGFDTVEECGDGVQVCKVVAVVAAVVTPPDPISMITLSIPLVLLYEVSIWCVRLIELRRKKDDAAEGLSPA